MSRWKPALRSGLKRLLRRAPWRVLRELAARQRGSVDPLAVLAASDASAPLLVQALEDSLRGGGYLTADRLAYRLRSHGGRSSSRRARLALADLDRAFGRDDGRSARPRTSLLGHAEHELVAHNLALAGAHGAPHALNRYLARKQLPRCLRNARDHRFLHDLAFAPCPVAPDRGLISVIMSAYNAVDTIRYAVDSVLAQSYPRLELLVCDDASVDGTWELLRQSYAGDARVRLFRSDRNQGTYNVRNALVPLTRGAYVTFQDADDLALPVRLERQVERLEGAAVACVANWLRVRSDGRVVFFWDGRAARMSVVSLLARREALLALLPYPGARFGADLDLLRLLGLRFGRAAIARVEAPLLLGLWSERSLTRTPHAEALESGYRSPARREYSELLFRRDLLGEQGVSRATIEAVLRATDNYVPASSVTPLSVEDSVPRAQIQR